MSSQTTREDKGKNFDFARTMSDKVDSIRDDANYKISPADMMAGQKDHLKGCMEDVYTEYLKSDKSKKSGKSVAIDIAKPTDMTLSDKVKYGLDKIAPNLLTEFMKSSSAAMHRGENYHLYFTKGKLHILPAGEKHFETMEDLVVSRVVGKMTENDNNISKTKRDKAFTEYNTLKAKL